MSDDQARQPSGMDAAPPAAVEKRKGWPLSSLLLFGLAAVLAVLSVLLYTGVVRFGAQMPPPPQATPGAIRAVDVVEALRAQGLDAQPAQKLFVPRGPFSVPGQGIEAQGAPLFTFIFPDPATASREFAAADPSAVIPEKFAGDGVDPANALLVQGSNVVVAYAGTDADARDRVARAVEDLP